MNLKNKEFVKEGPIRKLPFLNFVLRFGEADDQHYTKMFEIITYEMILKRSLEEITTFITALEDHINEIISNSNDFEIARDQIIERLKEHGHKLYLIDYDSDIYRVHEKWGQDYMQPSICGLEIHFWKPGRTKVSWLISSEGK